MSLLKPVAATALALGMLAASAGGAFAYSVAWAHHNSAVKANPSNAAATVNWLHNGQQVTVLGCFSSNWCKVSVPGQDGFVKKAALNFGWNNGNNGWHGWNGGNNGSHGNGIHGQACITGPHGYFCIGG